MDFIEEENKMDILGVEPTNTDYRQTTQDQIPSKMFLPKSVCLSVFVCPSVSKVFYDTLDKF